MKCIERQILDRREQPEAHRLNPVIERAAPAANGAVADADMVKIGVHFEPDPPAVTRALISLDHYIVFRDAEIRCRETVTRSASIKRNPR